MLEIILTKKESSSVIDSLYLVKIFLWNNQPKLPPIR
ncbi:MAG: hypothetical protein UR28_C0008G0014 [Candidatus Peregrinibacteria bacterium GW2011_GWF2_33_10]|nr:MAG: hypothetical protein UR28_C0008G0014 [Candidatus Peregrinibacteria bacterium GW2011_GWF2_33_10]